ncbi:A-kinase anchor protein 10, mitochondrial isoform X1 [Bombyx mori]|uniref:RGS domain-containing protein n=2 Tax=Bombyx mori TaxID=7091 RepID=A0A8R1WMP9_BOMMO|nr:A-kinase anchor protein 10, mitochondrial isoform X1 [Bombyx mori]
MIKFWKSAAKGKSGCPVRPPEKTSETTVDFNNILSSTQFLHDIKDSEDIFEKKSKLSLSLNDTLLKRKATTYFMQYMETIGQHLLVKCWLDLEDFKSHFRNTDNVRKNNFVFCKTQSCDLYCDHSHLQSKIEHKEKISQKANCHNTVINTNNTNITVLSSTSSCGSLFDQVVLNMYGNNKKSQNSTEEAVNLFKKYIALEAPYQIDIPDNVRKSVITNICHVDGPTEDCFKSVQDMLFTRIEENHFGDFLNTPLYIKAQIDILTNGSLQLKDILYNDTLLFYFTEYLEQESCRILLEFLMAIIHFRDNLINNNNDNADQAQADAIVIYEKYFSLQATNPLGFPTDIRLKIESEICRENGPQYDCFDLPYRIVYMTVTHYVKTFLESNMYYKYLSEMIHSVDYNMSSLNHKSYSDCSSEYSVSTQNTLLAMGDPVFRRKKRNHSVPDMTIDSNQLYNADSLWKRTRHEGLTLGRINSLGRFESKFEPDPDKKESVLKKMVNRFVPISTSKVEEEMAWQIAHMIVKDVTDLTMAPPDNEEEEM